MAVDPVLEPSEVTVCGVLQQQTRQGYAHMDPSMAFAYGPDLSSRQLSRRLPEYGEGLAAPQAAFQQPGRGMQGAGDASGFEGPAGQQPETAYQSGRQRPGDN